MKRLYLVLVSSLVAVGIVSCGLMDTGTKVESDAGGMDEFDLHRPLKVPSLATFRKSPERPLQGQYVAQDWSSLPGWNQESAEHLWLATINNCRGLMRPVSGSLNIPARATPADWQPFCAAVSAQSRNLSGTQVKAFFEQFLQPWKLSGNGLATGYYEPIVHGSRHHSGKYQWPMYAVPDDLLTIDLATVYPDLVGKRVRGKVVGNKVVPYDTREQIGNNAKKPPVIVWLNNPVDAFFMQVQGSGRVKLDNGQIIRLAYADHNGRPYSSIGRWLADRGELQLSQASMQNIKQWAKNNPTRVQQMLNSNQSMVFFKEERVADSLAGPKGAYGVPLIAQRAVAVDPTYIPLGTPLFLSTTYPSSDKLQRTVFAQDTGAAIKGAARVDFFWGSGDEAGEQAGHMKQKAALWLLWPKQAGVPSAR